MYLSETSASMQKNGDVKAGSRFGRRFKLFEATLFLYGFLGAMPILTFGGFTVFFYFSIIVILLIISRSLRGSAFKVPRKSKIYFTFTVLSLCSAAVCIFSAIPEKWKGIQPKSVLWELVYIVIVIYFSNRRSSDLRQHFFKGVYYSAILQTIWGLMQVALYRIAGVDLNKAFFSSILNIQGVPAFSQIKGNSMALTGFCWNAGNMVPLISFGYIFTNNIWLKLLFAFAAVVSGSRTTLLSIIGCVVLDIILNSKNKSKSHKIKFSSISAIFLGGLVVLGIFIFSSAARTKVLDLFDYLIFALRKNKTYFDPSTIIHTRYWTSILSVAKFAGPLHVLFGFGLGCSGYPFEKLFGQFGGQLSSAWVVECDPINILWSNGLIYLLLWYTLILRGILKGWKTDKLYSILFIVISLSGITYNIRYNWCYLLILFLFENINEKLPV